MTEDVRREAARNVARIARQLGIPMREVRGMTLRDVEALQDVLKEEQTALKRRQQAAQRKPSLPRRHG